MALLSSVGQAQIKLDEAAKPHLSRVFPAALVGSHTAEHGVRDVGLEMQIKEAEASAAATCTAPVTNNGGHTRMVVLVVVVVAAAATSNETSI